MPVKKRKRASRVPSGHLIPTERIERGILLLRGEKVILDVDLAELYAVPTKVLNQAVRRNLERFPADFMFQLTPDEVDELNRSQIVTGSQKHRNPRFAPFAFTEQGVAMLSSVLHSPRAIQVNLEIMRTFVRLRLLLSSNAKLSRKLQELEKKYDNQFRVVFDAIQSLLADQVRSPKRMGF